MGEVGTCAGYQHIVQAKPEFAGKGIRHHLCRLREGPPHPPHPLHQVGAQAQRDQPESGQQGEEGLTILFLPVHYECAGS